jgi:hypothetical protein
MAVDDGLIGAMSQTTQHAIALVWGALILLLVLGRIGWRLKARVQRRPQPERRLPRRWFLRRGVNWPSAAIRAA